MIETIARGFPPNISAVLVGVNNVQGAMERLRQADYYFRVDVDAAVGNKRYGTGGPHSRFGTDHRRSAHAFPGGNNNNLRGAEYC